MTDTPTPDEPKKRGRKAGVPTPPAPVFDYSRPIPVIVDRTETTIKWTQFQADTAAEAVAMATSAADALAIKTGRVIAVFGPQIAVKTPPTQAADMPLGF